MSTSTLNIKQENFHVNFDQLKEKDWIPAVIVMKLLTLTHGQPGGTQLAAFTKFVANIPFEAQTALQLLLDTHCLLAIRLATGNRALGPVVSKKNRDALK